MWSYCTERNRAYQSIRFFQTTPLSIDLRDFCGFWESGVLWSIGDKHLPQMILVIVIQTQSFGGLLSRVTDFESKSVLPLRSGEPEADGRSDRKTVKCPSIGSCMILMLTLMSGDPLCGFLCEDLISWGLLS